MTLLVKSGRSTDGAGESFSGEVLHSNAVGESSIDSARRLRRGSGARNRGVTHHIVPRAPQSLDRKICRARASDIPLHLRMCPECQSTAKCGNA